ncbi:hypothetical protein CTI12_AA567470 [Artemisia annua]|uniref:Uncharacterized protein n=1 Tax=Artemisia annua TaxID=35608 RepID=A0A2U1KT88_ARTAN|nr:hypothetical protein CTI12_AA567470 [Artemisia annua]
MSFIMEFAENLILRMMEDPVERDRKFREHTYHMKERCAKTKEMWSYPIRPYGFWTFDRHNAQIFWDAQISQVEGRRDPYDDLLQDHQTEASSSSKGDACSAVTVAGATCLPNLLLVFHNLLFRETNEVSNLDAIVVSYDILSERFYQYFHLCCFAVV